MSVEQCVWWYVRWCRVASTYPAGSAGRARVTRRARRYLDMIDAGRARRYLDMIDALRYPSASCQ